jgi:hypothetical protein
MVRIGIARLLTMLAMNRTLSRQSRRGLAPGSSEGL